MAHLQCDERKITITIPRVHPPILGFTPGRAGKEEGDAGWMEPSRARNLALFAFRKPVSIDVG